MSKCKICTDEIENLQRENEELKTRLKMQEKVIKLGREIQDIAFFPQSYLDKILQFSYALTELNTYERELKEASFE